MVDPTNKIKLGLVPHSLLLSFILNFSRFLKLSINSKANFDIFECVLVYLNGKSNKHLQVKWVPGLGKESGWQKLCEGTKGLSQKVWTQTKILSPNILYIVKIL